MNALSETTVNHSCLHAIYIFSISFQGTKGEIFTFGKKHDSCNNYNLKLHSIGNNYSTWYAL